ncbi:flagellar basal body-associated FliL family protein [Hirschia litorea]|uniref:Flagellar protein FliL n=1 Tax=Hirschia litorea TaxID=1199156 RepID=A0ABW2ILS4_9PROT
MAKDTTKSEDAAGDEEKPAKKKLAGKTMVLFFVIPALLIMGGGVAVGMMLAGGGKDDAPVEHAAKDDHGDEKADDHGKAKDDHGKAKDDHGKKDDGHAESASGGGHEGPSRETGTLQVGNTGDPSYYIMPDLLVNLASQDGDRQLFLKLKLTLEAEDPEMFADIPKMLPRITDQYQMFLRELRVDDLNGSAGGYRLRLELLRRINIAIAPSRVDAVLIEEMLVQ